MVIKSKEKKGKNKKVKVDLKTSEIPGKTNAVFRLDSVYCMVV